MNKFLLFTLIFFPSLFIGQIPGKYIGGWYESFFEYRLFSDSTFWFREWGHIGSSRSSGKYHFFKDTIILRSTKSDSIPSDIYTSFNDRKFIYDGKDCIIEYSLGYDYCKSNFESFGDTAFTYYGSKKRLNTNFRREEPYQIEKWKQTGKAKPTKEDSIVCKSWIITEKIVRQMIDKGIPTNIRKSVSEYPCTYYVFLTQKGRRYICKIDTKNQIEFMGDPLFLEYKE